MANFAFVAPPFSGHFGPLQAVAGELIRRGHRASFFAQPDAGRLIGGGAVEFVALGAASHPAGSLDQTIARINALNGLRGLGRVMRDLVRTTDMLCRELPSVLAARSVDVVVADQTEAAGGLAARYAGLPYVSVASALPINRDPAVPPPFTAWRYDPTDRGRRRNVAGYRVAEVLMCPMRRVIARYAQAWGLGHLRTLEDCLSPTAQLSQLIAGLDFPRAKLPTGFRYTGPLRHRTEQPEATGLPPAPFAFATLGTLQGNRPGLFAAIAQGCQQAGLGCLIAHGGRLTAEAASQLRGVPTVSAWVHQPSVLMQATAVITHGGMNTVLDALSFGLPIIAIPLAFEQAAIAARLEHAGVGRTLRARGLRPAALAETLRALLNCPDAHSRAGALRTEIAAAGGVALAADIIEAHVPHPM